MSGPCHTRKCSVLSVLLQDPFFVWRSSKQNWRMSEYQLICLKSNISETHHRLNSLQTRWENLNTQQLLGTDLAYYEKGLFSQKQSCQFTKSSLYADCYFVSLELNLHDLYSKMTCSKREMLPIIVLINSAGSPKTSTHISLGATYSWQHMTHLQRKQRGGCPMFLSHPGKGNRSTTNIKALVVSLTATHWERSSECEAMMQKNQWDSSLLLLTQRNHWLWCDVTVGDGLGNVGGTGMETGWEMNTGLSQSSFAMRMQRFGIKFW